MAFTNDDPRRSTTRIDKKKGFLSEVSFATVFASALAAGTALVLSSKIGVAGSLIGTVIAAAASSFAGQIYQQLIHRSAEKLQNVTLPMAFSPSDKDTREKSASSTQDTRVFTQGVSLTDKTVVQKRPLTLSDKTAPHEHAETGTPIAPHSIRQAAAERTSQLTWRSIAVALVAALVALALTAGIISLITAGEGLGSKTVFMPPTATDTVDDTHVSNTGTQPPKDADNSPVPSPSENNTDSKTDSPETDSSTPHDNQSTPENGATDTQPDHTDDTGEGNSTDSSEHAGSTGDQSSQAGDQPTDGSHTDAAAEDGTAESTPQK